MGTLEKRTPLFKTQTGGMAFRTSTNCGDVAAYILIIVDESQIHCSFAVSTVNHQEMVMSGRTLKMQEDENGTIPIVCAFHVLTMLTTLAIFLSTHKINKKIFVAEF